MSTAIPPFLNGHVPKGTDKAKLIDALVTFGTWVKTTTDQAKQAAEAAAASVNAENIIRRTLDQIPDEVIPFKVDVVTSSKSVPVPSAARAVKVTVRSGGATSTVNSNVFKAVLGTPQMAWVAVHGSGHAQCTVGASKHDIGSNYPNTHLAGISTVVVGGKTISSIPHPKSSADYYTASTRPVMEHGFEGLVVLEWFKKRPEGL